MRETRTPPEPRRRVWLAGVAPAAVLTCRRRGWPGATPVPLPVGPVDWVNVLTGQAQSLTCGPRRKNKEKENVL